MIMGCNAIKLAEYLMQKYPLADSYPYKSWSYPQGFYLWAIIRLFEKTGDERYYDYVLAYGNTHVEEDGTITKFVGDCLDDIMPASVLIWLYTRTKEEKFKLAAEKVRKSLDLYPRNSSGGWLHGKHLQGEMWADGLFMELMFLVRYGKYIGDEEDEPIVNTTETKINREVSKIYTSDKIDDNVEAKNGKYLYLELAEDKNSNKESAQENLESLKISISQDKANYFTNSKSFNVNSKS